MNDNEYYFIEKYAIIYAKKIAQIPLHSSWFSEF